MFELEENAFFNLEDSVITRGRSTYIANDPELAQVALHHACTNRSWPLLTARRRLLQDHQASRMKALESTCEELSGLSVCSDTRRWAGPRAEAACFTLQALTERCQEGER